MLNSEGFTESGLEGVWKYNPPVYIDSRGTTSEWFSSTNLPNNFLDFNVNQLLNVKNAKNVIRGIHFSSSDNVQLKIVKCVQGSILDLVVDLRIESDTFGQHEVFLLDEDNEVTLFIPHGFGHAYQTLSEVATVQYALQTEFRFSEEYVLNPYDDSLGISWQGENHILSEKDKHGLDFKSFFRLS